MTLVQILIVIFSVFMISRIIIRLRGGASMMSLLLLWLVLWIGTIVVALLPQTTSWFARIIGVGRGVDAVIYCAILFLYYLVFRMFVRLEKIDHDISLIVRQISLKKDEDDEKRG